MDNNTKKVLEKLLKIASNQQKIINKLAQAEGLPQHVDPGGATHTPSKALYDNLPPELKAAVQHVEIHGNTVTVTFKPGMANQAALKKIQAVFTSLQERNVIMPGSYEWEAQ